MSRSRRAAQFAALLIVLLVFGFAAGCGDDTESTATTGATQASEGAATTSADVSEPIKMDLLCASSSPVDPGFILTESYARRVEEASGGKVQIKVHPAGTICNQLEIWDATLAGIGDITIGPIGWAPQRFGLTSFIGNTLHRVPDAVVASDIVSEIAMNSPEIQAEWATEWKVLYFAAQVPGIFHLTKRAETMADLKGMQIRLPADLGAWGSALGATPVSIPFSDIYVSLQKGIIDGAWSGPAELKTQRLAEVCPFSLHIPLSPSMTAGAMSIEAWNSLPDDVKAAFESVVPAHKAEQSKAWNEAVEEAYEYAKTEGHELIEPAPEEMSKILEALYAADLAYVEMLEDKGLPATAVLNAVRQAEKKYKDQLLWPESAAE